MTNNLTVFIVVGRLGKSLTLSKVQPFVECKYINKVYVFREKMGFTFKGAEYITVPKQVINLKPRFLQKSVRRFYEFFQLLFYAIKYRPDFINGVGVKPKGWNSTIVSHLISSKCIFSIIGGEVSITTYYRLKRFWKRVNLLFIKNSAIVTTKGNTLKEYLIKNGIDKRKIYVFNGSIDADKYWYNESISKNIDILFVGTFRVLKGPDRVLRIIMQLVRKQPNLKAIFLGDGYLFDKINRQVNEYNLSRYVKLLGHVENTIPYFQKAKVIVMPSRSEGLPTAMLEAMACGCVPVVSDVGNIRDAALHGENAFIVEDYLDTNKFATYTNYLLDNEAKRLEMAKAGIKLVFDNYTIEAQVKIVEKIIMENSS